jgi:hypothetical protein
MLRLAVRDHWDRYTVQTGLSGVPSAQARNFFRLKDLKNNEFHFDSKQRDTLLWYPAVALIWAL